VLVESESALHWHKSRYVFKLIYRIAEKGGKPEDQGLVFPEYACHGGGKLSVRLLGDR
jgi:hypothetical protein